MSEAVLMISRLYFFFDGGLPAHKRDIRLERLEKTRKQLRTYRQVYPQSPQLTSAAGEPADLNQAVWKHVALSTRQATPPPPPFMVASVIETLLQTKWREDLQIVPGEADAFCAQAAKATDAAVLTSDSDLVVYDLGDHGWVILLHSMERTYRASTGQSYITAFGLNPASVAKRLTVPSLLLFGFERYMDPSVSVATVKDRARNRGRVEKYKTEYSAYTMQYSPTNPAAVNLILNTVDPRTAELLVDMNNVSAASAHLFLPVLFEDPSRDSSWSYGSLFRQLACSILLLNQSLAPKPVFEYARKGGRIAATSVNAVRPAEINQHIADVIHLFDQYLGLNSKVALSEGSVVLHWWILGLHCVCEQKTNKGKTPPTVSVYRILGLSSVRATASWTWDDLHLHANTQAVLYSIRILAQIVRHVIQRDGTFRLDVPTELQELHLRLETMPDIQDLFLDLPQLRAYLSSTPDRALKAVKPLLELIEQEQVEEEKIAPGHASPNSSNSGQAESETRASAPSATGTVQNCAAGKQKLGQRRGMNSNSFSILMQDI